MQNEILCDSHTCPYKTNHELSDTYTHSKKFIHNGFPPEIKYYCNKCHPKIHYQCSVCGISMCNFWLLRWYDESANDVCSSCVDIETLYQTVLANMVDDADKIRFADNKITDCTSFLDKIIEDMDPIVFNINSDDKVEYINRGNGILTCKATQNSIRILVDKIHMDKKNKMNELKRKKLVEWFPHESIDKINIIINANRRIDVDEQMSLFDFVWELVIEKIALFGEAKNILSILVMGKPKQSKNIVNPKWIEEKKREQILQWFPDISKEAITVFTTQDIIFGMNLFDFVLRLVGYEDSADGWCKEATPGKKSSKSTN